MGSRRPARPRVRRPSPRSRVRRRPVRFRGRRRPRTGEVLVLAVVALWVLGELVRWLAGHLWVVAVALGLAAAGAVLWWHRRNQRAGQRLADARALRYSMAHIDQLHHRDFEFAIRDLMYRDGCTDAVQVGGAGDNGADVKATDPYGRRWVIQCKHRRAGLAGAAVGTPALQVLNGTGRPVHKGDVIVLVTNGRFSGPALDFARSQRLHLVDRATLATWADGHRPLWELLRAVPSPRAPGPSS
ncbi:MULTISPECIES: restriction endonuclease [unclassified Streptomyces]|uniref:restriction endonuclease n=1 Tax=unclassified Streptomyces TaxID=2593676 RepID=UPI0036FF00B1